MEDKVFDKLQGQGITLPAAATPAANYVPIMQSGNLLFVSGQLPFVDGKLLANGLVGEDVAEEMAVACARQCGLNILAQVKAHTGSLDAIVQIVKLGGFVACVPTFTRHPVIINGASDMMVTILGDVGRHARFAVGAPCLPLGTPVEIDAVVAIR
ncbi:MAG: RidA family protein [Pseudomonadota bacterium]